MAEIRFDGQVVIVTGAGNGLGKNYALALAARGASVVVNDLGSGTDGIGTSHREADAVADEIRAAGGIAVASYDSVASAEGGRAIVQTALDSFGRIDALINNAGILRNRPFIEQTPEDLERTLATHLMGSFYGTQAAFGVMQRNGYGRIVLTGSSVGAFGTPWGAAYGAAKGGIMGLMNVVALEGQKHGILCNIIMPGAITRMGPLDVEDVPEDLQETVDGLRGLKTGLTSDFVAPMVLYLASNRCQVTHSIYSAIGGRYARAFVGLTRGWQGPTDAPATVEDIETHLHEIQDRDGYIIPNSGAEELAAVASGRTVSQSQGGRPAASLRRSRPFP